jgi:D-3-phosphoglycerate dehydrogenase
MRPLIWIDTTSYTECISNLHAWANLSSPEDSGSGRWQASLQNADAAIATARHCFDAAALQQAPRLKIIARLGVGYDNIDIETATALGICVTITPDGSTQSVAEHSLALMLALCRHIQDADRSIRTNQWSMRQQILAPDVQSLTLGIIGLGRIGGRLAQMAKCGVGMRVIAYDPFISKETILNRHAEPCETLEDLLAQADVISLHVPGNRETRHMLNHEKFECVKRGAMLINTARGSIVSEVDLVNAIQTGQLSGAALDVFENEPVSPLNPLLNLPGVILSPHFAGISTDSLRRIGIQAAEQVHQALLGSRPEHLINPQVWGNHRRTEIHE